MERIKQKIALQYDSATTFFSDSISKLKTHEGFIRYFKNTGWLFAGKMLGMIGSFFVGAYVARYLGPSQYGLLNYSTSFVGLFSVFASLGIDSILNRELVSSPEKKNELLGSGFLIKIIGSIIAIIFIVLALLVVRADSLTSALVLISAFIFIFNAFGVIDIYFQSQVLAKNTVKIQIISLLITTILKILFIIFNLNLIYFAVVYLVDAIILSIGLIFIYKKIGFHISKWKINKPIILMLLRSSWPMMFSSIAIAIYMKIDQVMIKNMLGNEANGIYSVAVKISEVWYFVPGLICASLFPAIMNAKKTNPIIYKERLQKLYSLLFYLSVGIAVPISILSSTIIINLFGPNYTEAIDVLKIHIWAGVGVFLGYAVGQYLIIENYTKIFLITTVAGAIINILLNILFIPKLGIIGAAIATTISYIFVTFSIVMFKKTKEQGVLIIKSIIHIK